MAGKTSMLKYPRACGVLVAPPEPTERERSIDLRSGAENLDTSAGQCGVVLSNWDDDRRHMAAAHPSIWAVIELLAEVRARRIRENV
jgi:hypothetical protein